MEIAYQQNRRMSGPTLHSMSNNIGVGMNMRRNSIQTPACVNQQYTQQNFSPIPQALKPNVYNSGDVTGLIGYPEKMPLRSTLSAPMPQFQQNTMNTLLQRRCSLKDPTVNPTNDESARYKTELCRSWEESRRCRYGIKCQFAHGTEDLRNLHRHPKYKTTHCRTYHTTGFCSYGTRCNFIHDEERRGSLSAALPLGTVPSRTQQLPVQTGAISSVGDSPASSISSGSPTHSPSYLTDDLMYTPSPCPSDEELHFHYNNLRINLPQKSHTGDLDFDLKLFESLALSHPDM